VPLLSYRTRLLAHLALAPPRISASSPRCCCSSATNCSPRLPLPSTPPRRGRGDQGTQARWWRIGGRRRRRPEGRSSRRCTWPRARDTSGGQARHPTVGHHRGVGGRRSGSGLVRARVEQRAGEASIAVLAVKIRPGVHDTGRGPAPRAVHAEKAHERCSICSRTHRSPWSSSTSPLAR
ncbi:ADPATP carrier protein 1 chloroplastic, partial [Zea mays]